MAAKNKKKQNSNGFTSTNVSSSVANNINNINTNESPLRLFGEAKEKINALYKKLDRCVTKANHFYSDSQIEQEVLENVDLDRLRRLNRSIETIRGVLSRNHMKVAFFGHTSNGKSTVINAILHDNVLPRGYGVTTKCFLQIQGTHEQEAFVEVHKKGQPDEKKPITFVSQMANALNRNSLECSTLLKIHWPVSKCSLLKYDVVFVDSPGVNVDQNLDEWIDDYCHDADVFVLVSSSESTLNIAEKNFFHKVSEKLSKPNIFILNNRFDIIDQNEPESMDQVREQHIERAVDFLSQELKISTPEEAKRRTFFVSAKETLGARCPAAAGPFNSQILGGYKERGQEFENFEHRFEESLSKSAVKTKFMKHCDKGKETINELTTILSNTRTLVSKVSERKLVELQNCHERFTRMQKLFYSNESNLQKQIFEIKKSIQIVSDTEFDNEIRRLSRVVDDFDLEFSTHPSKLNYYKEQLYLHVEDCLSENLKSRIYSVISKHVNPFNNTISDISTLLTPPRQQFVKNMLSAQTYIQDDLFDLRIYKQFYTEFQEDLEFAFSLGLMRIIRKFQSRFSSAKSISMNDSSDNTTASMRADTEVISILERFIMNPPQSPTTVGSLAIGGILVRTVGWKVIIITTAVYGALYAYEYLTWTNSAKERAFKAQYVRYAKKGLQDCVPIISQHIANSVEQKMLITYGKVKEEIDIENSENSSKISLLKDSLDKLRICDDFTRDLLGENNSLMNELVAFALSFLE